jgi:hypothetical protein
MKGRTQDNHILNGVSVGEEPWVNLSETVGGARLEQERRNPK